MSTPETLGLMLCAIAIFAVVFIAIPLLAARFSGRTGERIQAASFVLPTLLFILVPVLATGIGLFYALVVDCTPWEKVAKCAQGKASAKKSTELFLCPCLPPSVRACSPLAAA